MKHFFFLIAWLFLIAGVALTGLAGVSLAKTIQSRTSTQQIAQTAEPPAATQNTPQDPPQGDYSTVVEVTDARAVLIQEFLERYNSPLRDEENFAAILVQIADESQLDFRLLPAIAMKESGICKAIPANSYNCLGLGVHSKGTWQFNSYEENFRTAARILKKKYVDIGLVTPEQIMTKYTPNSPNGAWAKGINQFMAEMQYNDRALGLEDKTQNPVDEFVTK